MTIRLGKVTFDTTDALSLGAWWAERESSGWGEARG